MACDAIAGTGLWSEAASALQDVMRGKQGPEAIICSHFLKRTPAAGGDARQAGPRDLPQGSGAHRGGAPRLRGVRGCPPGHGGHQARRVSEGGGRHTDAGVSRRGGGVRAPVACGGGGALCRSQHVFAHTPGMLALGNVYWRRPEVSSASPPAQVPQACLIRCPRLVRFPQDASPSALLPWRCCAPHSSLLFGPFLLHL